MHSRKQFLKDIVIWGFRTLAPLVEAPGESGQGLKSDCYALTELSPSLLKIEAERLGLDPANVDEAELRSKIYAALSEQRR